MTPSVLLAAALWGGVAAAPVAPAAARLDDEIRSASGFRQVRAAEYRLTPQPEFPVDAGDPGTRIGQYRVRAAAGQTEYADRIRRAALDPDSPALAHALESAAKLRLPLAAAERAALRRLAAARSNELESAYSDWWLAANGDRAALDQLAADVVSSSAVRSTTAAYAAGYLAGLPEPYRAALRRAAAAPLTQTGSFALWSLARHRKVDAAEVRRIIAEAPAGLPEKVLRYHLLALGECGDAVDLPYLAGMLRSPEPEIANAAAAAILLIANRAR